MSVEGVMNTIASQDATSEMGADMTGGSVPAGQSATGKPSVGSIDDVFNLYEPSVDEVDNGVELKEDKKNVPDELNNQPPKEEVKEEVKEEPKKEEPKQEETKQEFKQDKVKVKVNGVEQEVPLQDVINSYSGQQEIQRRFTEFDKQRKSFEKEKQELVEYNNFVKGEFEAVKTGIDAMVRQFETNGVIDKNPLSVLNQLLDKMGINSNTFNRALFEHQLPEYAKFFNMTDVERDAYFTRQENEYLRRKEQGFTERDQQLKANMEKQQKDLELIRSNGLDSVKYEALKEELVDAGLVDANVEQVVEYAKQKPTLERVVKIFETAKIGLDDPRSAKVKEILLKFPDTTDDEILDRLVPDRYAQNIAKELEGKKPKTVKLTPQQDEDDELADQLAYYRR